MAFVSKGHRILDRGYRLIIDHLPGDEEKIINFLKRLIPIAWLGTMVFATLIVTFIVSIQVTSDSEVFVAQYTIENYVSVIKPLHITLFIDTVKIAALSSLLAVVLSYPAAYYIGVKLTKRIQYPLLLGFVAPMWTLFIIRVYAWMTVLGTNGSVHNLLRFFGIVGGEFTLLNTQIAVIVVLAQIWFPMAFLPIYSAMSGLEKELLEAGQDLGGNRWDLFRYIVFPLTLPSAFGAFLIVFLLALGAYVIPLLVGGPKGMMFAQIIASQFLQGFDWPFGSALAIVLVVVVLGIVLILQRFIKFREALGGFAR